MLTREMILVDLPVFSRAEHRDHSSAVLQATSYRLVIRCDSVEGVVTDSNLLSGVFSKRGSRAGSSYRSMA